MLFAAIVALFKLLTFLVKSLLSLVLLPVKMIALGILIKVGMLFALLAVIAVLVYLRPGC